MDLQEVRISVMQLPEKGLSMQVSVYYESLDANKPYLGL